MGPGGPGGDSYDPNKNKPVVTYTSPNNNQGAGQSSSSSAPSADEIKNTKSNKQKLKDSLEGIVASQGQSGFETSGIAGQTISGKNKDGKNVSIVIPANVPEKFHQFLINNSGNQAGQAILNNYAASGVNPYQQQIQNFKNLPGGLGVFKEKFPNPLVKIAGGIGDFFKKGTLLGKFLSSLNKSDQNKLKTIQDEKYKQPYDPADYGLGGFYEDKILRDLNLKDRLAQQSGPEGLTLNTAGMNEGIMAGAEPYDAQAAYRRKVVEKYYGASGNISQAAIDKAYNQIISKMKESETNMEGPYAYQAGYPEGDYTNFQEEIVDEVVDDRYQAGPNEDNMMNANIFELGSGNLAGSVSETDYIAPNIEGTNPRGQVSSARSTPLIGGDPNVPYGYEENILDVLAEDNMATGGYMSSFPNQNLNTQSLSASDNIDDRIMKNLQFEKMSPGMMGYNAGGYAGMSTFDKLKMIADSGYQS